MRKYLRTTLLFAVLLASVPALASTATDFYMDLLQRGRVEVDAGRYDTSLTPLRLAAFGLVDSIEHYETAQIYLTVALDKLGKQDEARRAAQRVVAAEAIERKFTTLSLTAAMRTAFNAAARKLLSPADAATLTAPAAQNSAVPNRNGNAIVPPVNTTATNRAATSPTPSAPVPQPQTSQALQPQKPAVSTPRNEPAKVTEKPAAQTQAPVRNDPPPVTTPAGQSSSQKPKVTATAPKPVPPATAPPKAPSPAKTSPKTTPAAPKPETARATLQPQSQTVPPQTTRIDVPARLAAADRALNAANLEEGRRIYRELLAAPGLDRNSMIRVGEGLYRARDFSSALTALRRLGTLKPGEEAYRYYVAVALFETGDVLAARRELAAALPFIEITPDVQHYREKIDSAR
ncbi:MAG: hypothetical protein ABI779_17940 [Acidobacteriota bacterium]